MIKLQKKQCSICNGSNMCSVLEMPKFPFTGIYVTAPENPKYRGVDQSLLLCTDCGHAQLQNVLDPQLVYDQTYTHRSSISPIATGGNDFFANFLETITVGKTFNRILDVGCNDVYLLQKIAQKGELLFGIDPIWKGKTPPTLPRIKVFGKFVEEFDAVRDMGGQPDLVISAHTFEHIEDPRQQMERLVSFAADNATFLIEVPSFDTLVNNYRFDQVFHQHLQYYSLASFERLVQEIGCEYVAHTYNYSYWGGTMLFAFKKPPAGTKRTPPRFAQPTTDQVAASLRVFQEQMTTALNIVSATQGDPIYGYGAAQMLPTVAYHMHSDFSFMKSVLDDNADRNGLTYPYMPIVIEKPAEGFDLRNATVLVTALDSARPILKRVFALGAKRVVLPLNLL